MTLSQRLLLTLCSAVRGHCVSLAPRLCLSDGLHALRGSVSLMCADKLAHESVKIRFVQRAHKHMLWISPLVSLPLQTLCVSPVVFLISSEEPRQGSNELKSWGRGHGERLCAAGVKKERERKGRKDGAGQVFVDLLVFACASVSRV